METVLTDCFWCGEAYDKSLTVCPQCATKRKEKNGLLLKSGPRKEVVVKLTAAPVQ